MLRQIAKMEQTRFSPITHLTEREIFSPINCPVERTYGIFSYGTLRPDFTPSGDKWGVTDEDCQWRYGRVKGFALYQDPELDYPYAIEVEDQNSSIYGTVLKWTDSTTMTDKLTRCNQIECYRDNNPFNLYERRLVKVYFEEGVPEMAYLYYQTHTPNHNDLHFQSGDWLEK